MRTVPVRVLSWVSEDTVNGFPSKSFRMSIASASDSESTMTRQDLSGRVWKVTLPTCLWMHFWNWKVFFEYGAWAGIWKYLFHRWGPKRMDKGRWLVVVDGRGRGWEEEGTVWVIEEEEAGVESGFTFWWYIPPGRRYRCRSRGWFEKYVK